MGSTVCAAVLRDPDLELVAAVDPFHSGLDVSRFAGGAAGGLQISPSASSMPTSPVCNHPSPSIVSAVAWSFLR
jgi:hypothetical protein